MTLAKRLHEHDVEFSPTKSGTVYQTRLDMTVEKPDRSILSYGY